jgi:hypothetical protein
MGVESRLFLKSRRKFRVRRLASRSHKEAKGRSHRKEAYARS